MSRRILVNLVAFAVLFVAMVVWAVNNIITFEFIERPYEIKGEFAASVGVKTGSEVAYLGVNYGDVKSVESMPGGVLISMRIDRGKTIPAGSTARIFRKSAIGEPYIDFVPPDDYTDESPVIESGDVVPLDSTSVPLEFSEMLRAASRLIGAVDAGQTRTLVHELAAALNGRSDDLRALTTSSDALLSTFAERSELLDRLSANNTALTRTVTEHRGSLRSAVEDLALLADSLARVDGSTRTLLDRGTQLLGTAAELVDDIKQEVDCVLHDLADVTRLAASPEQLENLVYTLEHGPVGLGYVVAALDDEPGGKWIRVELLVNPDNPSEIYVPPTELPAVPTVPACVSTLSSGGSFEPTILSGSTAGAASMPATGGRPLHALAFLLTAGAVAATAARRTVTADR